MFINIIKLPLHKCSGCINTISSVFYSDTLVGYYGRGLDLQELYKDWSRYIFVSSHGGTIIEHMVLSNSQVELTPDSLCDPSIIFVPVYRTTYAYDYTRTDIYVKGIGYMATNHIPRCNIPGCNTPISHAPPHIPITHHIAKLMAMYDAHYQFDPTTEYLLPADTGAIVEFAMDMEFLVSEGFVPGTPVSAVLERANTIFPVYPRDVMLDPFIHGPVFAPVVRQHITPYTNFEDLSALRTPNIKYALNAMDDATEPLVSLINRLISMPYTDIALSVMRYTLLEFQPSDRGSSTFTFSNRYTQQHVPTDELRDDLLYVLEDVVDNVFMCNTAVQYSLTRSFTGDVFLSVTMDDGSEFSYYIDLCAYSLCTRALV